MGCQWHSLWECLYWRLSDTGNETRNIDILKKPGDWRQLGANWVPTVTICTTSQAMGPFQSLKEYEANGDKWWQMVMATKDAFGCTGHCPRALWGEGRAPTVHVIDAFSYIDEFILSLMPVSSPRDPQDQIMLILTIYSESTPVLEFFPIAIAGVPRDSERMVAIRRIRPNQHLLGLHAAQQIIRRFHGGSAVPGVGLTEGCHRLKHFWESGNQGFKFIICSWAIYFNLCLGVIRFVCAPNFDPYLALLGRATKQCVCGVVTWSWPVCCKWLQSSLTVIHSAFWVAARSNSLVVRPMGRCLVSTLIYILTLLERLWKDTRAVYSSSTCGQSARAKWNLNLRRVAQFLYLAVLSTWIWYATAAHDQ